MIPSPNDVSWCNTEAENVIAEIEKRLNQPGVPYSIDKGMRVVKLIVPGHLDEFQKAHVSEFCEEADWENVQVQNSSDNGERAGLVQVTLRAHPYE